jgi:hypothetical protein
MVGQSSHITFSHSEAKRISTCGRYARASRKHERTRVASAMNVLSGDTKILETNGHNKIKLYPNQPTNNDDGRRTDD